MLETQSTGRSRTCRRALGSPFADMTNNIDLTRISRRGRDLRSVNHDGKGWASQPGPGQPFAGAAYL